MRVVRPGPFQSELVRDGHKMVIKIGFTFGTEVLAQGDSTCSHSLKRDVV